MKKKMKVEFPEPIYDDVTLELIEKQETDELVAALFEYYTGLEKMVIDLRYEVNSLTPAGKREPYPDPASDFMEVFYDYPAYPKFQHLFEPPF
jgi:hypothetical protein